MKLFTSDLYGHKTLASKVLTSDDNNPPCNVAARSILNNLFGEPVNEEGLMIWALYYFAWEYIRSVQKAKHLEESYWAERRGRAR